MDNSGTLPRETVGPTITDAPKAHAEAGPESDCGGRTILGRIRHRVRIGQWEAVCAASVRRRRGRSVQSSSDPMIEFGGEMKTARAVLARLAPGTFLLAVVSSTLVPAATASSQAPVGLGTADS